MIVHTRTHRRGMSRTSFWVLAGAFALMALAISVLILLGFAIRVDNTGDWYLLVPAAIGVGLVVACLIVTLRDLRSDTAAHTEATRSVPTETERSRAA